MLETPKRSGSICGKRSILNVSLTISVNTVSHSIDVSDLQINIHVHKIIRQQNLSLKFGCVHIGGGNCLYLICSKLWLSE